MQSRTLVTALRILGIVLVVILLVLKVSMPRTYFSSADQPAEKPAPQTVQPARPPLDQEPASAAEGSEKGAEESCRHFRLCYRW